MPVEDDSVTSLSLEETNELRKKLGLKPLITETPEPNEEKEETGQDTEEVLERLNRVKQRRARESLIKGGGIADSIKKGEAVTSKRKKFTEGSEEVDPLDLTEWSKKMRRVNKNTIAQADNEVTYSDEEEEEEESQTKTEEDGSKIKVLHKMNELDLIKGEEITLTLKDVGVLEAEKAGISDMDFLENSELVTIKKDKKKMEQKLRNQYGNYIPYEEEDQLNQGFLKQYDDKIKETQGLKLTCMANEDEGFFIKLNQKQKLRDDKENPEFESYDNLVKNKRSTNKNELMEERDVFASLRAKKEKLKNKPKTVNWDKIFTKEEDLELHLENIVPTKIKKELSLLVEDEDDKLYTQISIQRNRVKNSEVKSEDSDREESTGHVDFGESKGEKAFEITPTTEFIKIVKTPHQKISEQESQPKYNISTPGNETKDEDPNTLSEAPLGDGISAALSYIKQRGDFIEKKAKSRSEDVQLNYLDSYGNEMTPKEAFRHISWVFHGKKPCMNKLEKKAKRMERERIAKQNPVEGLPTMKALFTHQANEESAHLVLTGHNPNN